MELSVDAWALKRITLDTADGSIPDVLIAHEGDANGRGIALSVVQGGVPADMAGMAVYLAWGHEGGSQGLTEFAAVDAAAGKWKVYYPEAMQRKGTVIARIMVYVGERTPITGSRDFRVFVEGNPVDEDAAITTDDFSVFKRAVEDLATARAEFEAAYTKQLADQQGDYIAAENERNGLYSAAEAERGSMFSDGEKARQSAEETRVSADAERTVRQEKNNADQQNNNLMARTNRYVKLDAGQYDHDTGVPTIGDPQQGITYLVPAPREGSFNNYDGWAWLLNDDGETGEWEMIGPANPTPDTVTTDDVDAAFSGSGGTGMRYMALNALNYLVSKAQAVFAPKSHKHGDADITAVSGSKLADASVSRAKLDAGLEADIAELEDAWDSVSQTECRAIAVSVNGASGSTNVQFRQPFSSSPAVTASVQTAYPNLWAASVSSVTPAGCVVHAASLAGQSATLYVYLIAIA